MAENVQLFVYGLAAVLDLVLLLSMLERPNWQYIAVWMLTLTIGVWMWHTGVFVQALLWNSSGQLALQTLWISKTVMAAGLLIMPSAMLHGLYRFTKTGVGVSARMNPWLCSLYLPLLLLLPISMRLATAPREPFLQLLEGYFRFYLCFMAGTNIIVSIGLWRLKKKIESPRVVNFFESMAWTLIGITLLNIIGLVWGKYLGQAKFDWIQMGVALSPVIPTLLFSYFVLRFQLLPLVIERTFIYGAIVAGTVLLHQIVMHDVAAAIFDQYRINFELVEGIMALGLILVYQPLRERVAEALKYLFGAASQNRHQNRRLSMELAGRSGQETPEILDWFTQAARSAFQVKSVTAILFEQDGGLHCIRGDETPLSSVRAWWLTRELHQAGLRVCTRYDAPNRAVLDLLQEINVAAVLCIEQLPQTGILLIGPLQFKQSLGNEELNAFTLLVEQLGVTLQNGQLQAARVEAERRALQHEKLSTLGLMAGSIAHEVKNPLSSIKAIATVMAEELGTDSPHTEDLRLILGEIDRLAITTSQLLEVARSPAHVAEECLVQNSLTRTVQLLKHLAHQQHVVLKCDIDNDLPPVTADDGTLREIFINLIANSIEAAGRGGTVTVICYLRSLELKGMEVVTEIQDTGPGLPSEIQENLFQPFMTTREAGTGLGLYVVGRRVQECGGRITCRTSARSGTTFIVHLPCCSSARNAS